MKLFNAANITDFSEQKRVENAKKMFVLSERLLSEGLLEDAVRAENLAFIFKSVSEIGESK